MIFIDQALPSRKIGLLRRYRRYCRGSLDFASTRVRTFRNSLMYVPNGKIADCNTGQIHGLRQYRRFYTTLILLPMNTPPLFNRRVCQGLREPCFWLHPDTRKDALPIFIFNNLSSYSQDIIFYNIFSKFTPGGRRVGFAAWDFGSRPVNAAAISLEVRFALPYPNTFIWSSFPAEKKGLVPDFLLISAFTQNKLWGVFMKTTLIKSPNSMPLYHASFVEHRFESWLFGNQGLYKFKIWVLYKFKIKTCTISKFIRSFVTNEYNLIDGYTAQYGNIKPIPIPAITGPRQSREDYAFWRLPFFQTNRYVKLGDPDNRTFGLKDPMAFWQNTLIKGHLWRSAAKRRLYFPTTTLVDRPSWFVWSWNFISFWIAKLSINGANHPS